MASRPTPSNGDGSAKSAPCGCAASGYSARDIADAALLREFTSDILVGAALLLEVTNAGIVGIVVGLDRPGPSGVVTISKVTVGDSEEQTPGRGREESPTTQRCEKFARESFFSSDDADAQSTSIAH